MQTESGDKSAVSFKRSCSKCAHAKVCTLLRAISPLLANWEEGGRPFEATDLAAICLEFLSPDTGVSDNL